MYPRGRRFCKACYINLLHECAIPALRAFSHSRRTTARLALFTVAGVIYAASRLILFDAAASATGYTSEDYSDAARQLSGQAHGGAGKRETRHLILQNSIISSILSESHLTVLTRIFNSR